MSNTKKLNLRLFRSNLQTALFESSKKPKLPSKLGKRRRKTDIIGSKTKAERLKKDLPQQIKSTY